MRAALLPEVYASLWQEFFLYHYYFFLLGLLTNKVWLVIVYSRLHRVLQCFDVSHLNLTIL